MHHRRRCGRRRRPARSRTPGRSSSSSDKVVVNDDGGSAIVGDFGITTSAGALDLRRRRSRPRPTPSPTPPRPSQVAPGTYTLAELALAGYAPSAWTCTNGDGGAFDAGSVTLAAGDPTVTCSITNDDQPVELVIREGRRQRRRRQRDRRRLRDHHQRRRARPSAPPSRPRPTPSPTPPRPSQVAPGTYTLAELALAGYAPSDWTCTNGDGGAFDAGSVTLAAGDPTVTCSITNDDQPVELVIRKVVVNDDGGSAIVGDFGITTSAGALDLRRRRRGPGRHLHLHRRDPRRSRPARTPSPSSRWPATRRPPGPAPTATAAPSTRAASPSPRATRRSPARSPTTTSRSSLVIRRSSSTTTAAARSSATSGSPPAPARSTFGAAVEAPADTFTYTAATLEVAPGTYSLAELALAGYAPSAWTCTNGDGGAFDAGSVTLAAGDPTVTCSITNDDQPGGGVLPTESGVPPGGSGGVLPDTGVGSGAQGFITVRRSEQPLAGRDSSWP